MFRLTLAFACCAVVASCQDAQAILAKMSQRYATLDAYHLEGVYEVSQTQGSNTGHSSQKFKLDGVDKSHKIHINCAPDDLACEDFRRLNHLDLSTL